MGRKYINCNMLCVIIVVFIAIIFSSCSRQKNVWYVEEGLEHDWGRILGKAEPPVAFNEIKTWDGGAITEGQGIIIAKKPWHGSEKAAVYNRLSFNLEHNGAIVLAVDPWMIFRKHTDPQLTADRVFSGTGGSGILLIAGRDHEQVKAWTARMVLGARALLPPDEDAWLEQEQNLFNKNLFPAGSQTYTWSDVFYRLMSNEVAWVYAPLSSIRGYRNFRKSILEAAPFPEQDSGRYSLQVSILWAMPAGSGGNAGIAAAMDWLKKPETQTAIADQLEWIPADPYGQPFDPVSFTSHRHWLVAANIYEINE